MLLDIDKKNPESIAVKDSDSNRLTYGDIIRLSEEITQSLGQREFIFLLCNNNIGGIAWVMAAIISGSVPLILNANMECRLLENLISLYTPRYICRPQYNYSEKNNYKLKKYGYCLYETKYKSPKLYPDLSHLLPSSGSTGSPKLIRHKYSNIEASAKNISTLFRLTNKERPLLVLPLYYTMGLSVVFSHLKVGATILITDKKMTDPAFWKFFKEEEATSFTGVPFSYEILDKMRFYRMNLPHLHLLTQGGGKMPEDLNRRFVEYCVQTGRIWIATYGQSEGTARMAWLPEDFALSKMGSIGIAVPNGRLSLIDDEGDEIKNSPAIGEMCYEGENVTMGYAFNREDLNLGDDRHGFLKTGDIAYRDEDGFYYIKGRIGRFLKIYGNRISLDECEHILKSRLNCDCAFSGNDEKIIIYITDPLIKNKVHEVMLEVLKIPSNIIEIRILDSIPKNQAGKTLYSKLENY